MEKYRDGLYSDLAVEDRERFPGQGTEVPGVSLEKKELEEEILLTRVEILDERGERLMGKSKGIYLTLERKGITEASEPVQDVFCEKLGEAIRSLLPKEWNTILIAGLGNRELTVDALGPRTVEFIPMNRHLTKEHQLCGVVPGVMAQTGMETEEIIKGILDRIHPDAVVVIDSLAARNSERLGSMVQLSDTGIAPGSGVGNHRSALSRKGLGIPVIAIGVPTVISGAALAWDTFSAMTDVLEQLQGGEEMASFLKGMEEGEQLSFVRQLLGPKSLGKLFVAPVMVDEMVDRFGRLLARSIKLAAEGR